MSDSVFRSWAVQELREGDNSSSNPTGLLIFGGRHYAYMVLSEADRPNLGDATTASADELRAAWGPLRAHAGTFEVAGDTLVTRPTVAKGTYPTSPGFFSERSLTFEASDTLVLTLARDSNGPVAAPRALRLTRVE